MYATDVIGYATFWGVEFLINFITYARNGSLGSVRTKHTTSADDDT
jgi:hypothetical protein